jgi:predicted RNA-binding protein YlqC (UPF0109 family)
MVRRLIGVPGLVTVRATERQHSVILEGKMAPTDAGKVIGGQGKGEQTRRACP